LKTIIISSLDENGQCVSSYAPFVRDGDDVFFCVSSVARHYHTIKANPDKVSIMFIEDEKDAGTILARNRLSANCEVSIVDDAKRDEIFDKLQAKNHNDGAFSDIKGMKDFYIMKATLKKGRFVKGFGAAYDTLGLEITKGLQDADPHTKR
ncbi:MAG: pyridoxamine 5'-phosphate oxidase family protein, partial [Campylobacter sp.]|nr:pyridoxamine 5'-phosphate oxidase family protein [Campylobacter sp.]